MSKCQRGDFSFFSFSFGRGKKSFLWRFPHFSFGPFLVSALDANFKDIARQILKKAVDIPSKKTFTAQHYMFHILNERGLTFLCVADSEMGHRVPYAFLNDVRDRFLSSGVDWKNSRELGLNDSFQRVLADRMHFYSHDPDADKINKVKQEVGKAKSVMMENIDKVIQRGENIEVLVDKTERLDMSSQTFKVKSKQLERKMCCKNAKLTALLIAIGVVLFIVILMIILWKTGAFHGSSGTAATTTGTTTTTSMTTSTTTSNQLTTSTTTDGQTTTTSTSGATTTGTTTTTPDTSTSPLTTTTAAAI